MNRLGRKFLARLILPTVLLASFLGAFNIYISHKAASLRANAELQETARFAATLIDEKVEDHKRLAESILAQEELENYFLLEQAQLLDDAETSRLSLESNALKQLDGHPLDFLELFTGSGDRFLSIVEDRRSLKPHNAKSEHWWPEESAPRWSITERGDGHLTLVTHMRLQSGIDRVIAVLRPEVQSLLELPLSFAMQGRQSSQAQLVSKKNSVLGRYGDAIEADRLLHSTADVDSLGARLDIQQSEWDILSPLLADKAQVGVMQLIVLLAVVATVFFSSKSLVLDPVEKLMKTVDKIASGEKIEDPELTSRDELASLDRALREAANRIFESSRQLSEVNQNLEERVAQRTAELEMMRDRALEASRAKSDFLANMSHEIRTPMNGVLGVVTLLSQTELDTEQKDLLKTMSRSGESLLDIINDILDFSKIEAGKITLEIADFDLHATIHDVTDLLRENAVQKELELQCDVAPDVPSFVLGDSSRLRQVLVNLVGNAIKFTDSGFVQLRVRSLGGESDESSPPTTRLKFEVQDTGVGIAQEALESIFESFSQADTSTTRRYGGTGLGLTISQRFVALMGGSLSVDSVESEGSTFSFTVELEVSDRKEMSNSAVLDVLKNRNVLVVDDIEANRQILSRQLTNAGLIVTCATSAADALEVVRRTTERGKAFDFGILDYQMPEISGLGLARELKSIEGGKTMKLLLLSSAYVDPDERAGLFDATFMKPVRPGPLLSAMADLYGDSTNSVQPKAAKSSTSTDDKVLPKFQGDVLIVEDNPVNQLVARKLLTSIGFDVEITDNGRKAVDRLAERDFDLIFMDCHMPVMDGYEATEAILVTRPEQVIVAMTASVLAEDRERCRDVGMKDYIPKPIELAQLIDVLERHCR